MKKACLCLWRRPRRRRTMGCYPTRLQAAMHTCQGLAVRAESLRGYCGCMSGFVRQTWSLHFHRMRHYRMWKMESSMACLTKQIRCPRHRCPPRHRRIRHVAASPSGQSSCQVHSITRSSFGTCVPVGASTRYSDTLKEYGVWMLILCASRRLVMIGLSRYGTVIRRSAKSHW